MTPDTLRAETLAETLDRLECEESVRESVEEEREIGHKLSAPYNPERGRKLMEETDLRAEAEKMLNDLGFGCQHEIGVCNPVDSAIVEAFVAFAQRAQQEGASQMLDSIRGSLQGYPDLGGDIEVMRSVERVEKRARLEGMETSARIADQWALSHTCNQHDYNPCCHVRTGAGIAGKIRAELATLERGGEESG